MPALFFKLLLNKGMADTQHPGGAPQALTFPVGTFHQRKINLTAFLFAVQHPVTAAVLTFVGLGARAVFTVFDNIDTPAKLTLAMFDNHMLGKAKYTNQLIIYTTK